MEQIGKLVRRRLTVPSVPTLLQSSESNELARKEICMDIERRYGNSVRFLSTFSPDKMREYSKHIERCIMGNAPTLYWVGQAYGAETAESFLEIQLKDMLSKINFNPDKQLTNEQVDDMANVILQNYGHLKVTEFGIFIQMLKAGKFGSIYGGDAITINNCLSKFIEYRRMKVTEYENEKKRKELEQYQQKIREGKTMNYLEWLEYKKTHTT